MEDRLLPGLQQEANTPLMALAAQDSVLSLGQYDKKLACDMPVSCYTDNMVKI